MNDAAILDDFERDVLCAVRAKAGQIDDDVASFSAEADPPCNVVRLTPVRAPRRGALAAVAAVLVAAGVGFTVVDLAQWLGSSGDPDVTMPSASATGTRHTMREAGTAGICLALDLPAACTHRVPLSRTGSGRRRLIPLADLRERIHRTRPDGSNEPTDHTAANLSPLSLRVGRLQSRPRPGRRPAIRAPAHGRGFPRPLAATQCTGDGVPDPRQIAW